MLANTEETRVEDVFDFINKFNLFSTFKEIYKVDIKDWSFDISDIEVIKNLLSKEVGNFDVKFIDVKDCYFIITEILKKVKSKKVKYLKVKYKHLLKDLPNFHKSGSIKEMRDQFYGVDALLVRCGDYIYNVTNELSIYNLAT